MEVHFNRRGFNLRNNSIKIHIQQFKLNYFTKCQKPKEHHQHTYMQWGKFTHIT